MFVFLSDLHLMDNPEYPAIDIARVLGCLRDLASQASRAQTKNLEIILLGDVLEFLRSREWLRGDLRPWEDCTAKHIETVGKIFDGIAEVNKEFFEGLRGLIADHEFVKLEYIPGNHDRVINTEMGKTARTRLQRLLPLQRKEGKLFKRYFIDEGLGVIAKHGHEWDPYNRYSRGAAAIGDAVVIDLLLRLPVVVSDVIKIPEDDPCLKFLREVDNVRPQSPRVIAQWLLLGLDRIKETYPEANQAVRSSFLKLAEDFRRLANRTKFEPTETASWWMDFLFRIANLAMKHFGTLSIAVHLPEVPEGPKPCQYYASEDGWTMLKSSGACRYIVSGHTHTHELIPLNLGSEQDPVSLYINTGTWRRTHQIAPVLYGEGLVAFSTWHEECVVCIYTSDEQASGFPPFEVRRFTCG